jgi:hypothetical protein
VPLRHPARRRADLLSTSLLRFEINLRSASVVGFVGAGGIGEELYKVISFNYYEEISAIILLIIAAVMPATCSASACAARSSAHEGSPAEIAAWQARLPAAFPGLAARALLGLGLPALARPDAVVVRRLARPAMERAEGWASSCA